jgi:hypothetical protein
MTPESSYATYTQNISHDGLLAITLILTVKLVTWAKRWND